MKFFTKFINFVKKAFRKVAEMFKDKNPVEVVNDVTKTAAAVVTTGVAIYAGINAVRVHLIPATKKSKTSEKKSGHSIILENREVGSIDEKIAELKRNASFIGKKQPIINKEDLEILESIASKRNSFFQSLSPEEQKNVLEMEEFDFEAYKAEYRSNKKGRLFRFWDRLKKMGVSPKDKPFREPVDYGMFNFILQPLDDFIHWLKNDPVPKKVPQIHLVDHPEIPDVQCESISDMVSAARHLDSYLSRNNTVSSEFSGASPAFLEEQQIVAEEMFRHKTLKKLNKAVAQRMTHSNFNAPSIFDMMDDDKEFKKKKKKDKDKKKKKKHDSDGSFAFIGDDSKKKKKSKNKEDNAMLSAAEKKARELYRYHLEKAMNGEIDRVGKFDF